LRHVLVHAEPLRAVVAESAHIAIIARVVVETADTALQRVADVVGAPVAVVADRYRVEHAPAVGTVVSKGTLVTVIARA